MTHASDASSESRVSFRSNHVSADRRSRLPCLAHSDECGREVVGAGARCDEPVLAFDDELDRCVVDPRNQHHGRAAGERFEHHEAVALPLRRKTKAEGAREGRIDHRAVDEARRGDHLLEPELVDRSENLPALGPVAVDLAPQSGQRSPCLRDRAHDRHGILLRDVPPHEDDHGLGRLWRRGCRARRTAPRAPSPRHAPPRPVGAARPDARSRRRAAMSAGRVAARANRSLRRDGRGTCSSIRASRARASRPPGGTGRAVARVPQPARRSRGTRPCGRRRSVGHGAIGVRTPRGRTGVAGGPSGGRRRRTAQAAARRRSRARRARPAHRSHPTGAS